MEETKFKGIILNSNDLKEADKIANVFSLEYGKISAKFIGVRRDKAKLKPLIQPFTFVELECIKRGDFYTVKTGTVIDAFPKLTTDYSRTICAYIVIEMLAQIILKNKPESELFLQTIKTMDNLELVNPYVALINYIINFFAILGENLNLSLEGQRIYLDLNDGNFTLIKSVNSIEIDKKCYENLASPSNNDNLNKMSLKLLNNVLRAKYDTEIHSFSFL